MKSACKCCGGEIFSSTDARQWFHRDRGLMDHPVKPDLGQVVHTCTTFHRSCPACEEGVPTGQRWVK